MHYQISLFLSVVCALGATLACGAPRYHDRSILGGCTVQTSSGILTGNCGPVNAYLGVPYLQPPVGENRFKPASQLRLSGQSSVAVNATKLSNACPQPPTQGYDLSTSENCLYLNVYSPSNAKNTSVMFWIHGGSFEVGGGVEQQLDGSSFAANEGVIVVTINYRLGALGWFNGQNLGLSDTIAALKWVHRNIAAFGGNPDSVTIAGQSSGATMAKYLLNSPHTCGLFERAIIQSHPADFAAFQLTAAQNTSSALAKTLGCTSNLDWNCMRNASLDQIIDHQDDTQTDPQNPSYNWGPTIDGNFIVTEFYDSVQNDSLENHVDLLVGTVNDEAGPTIGSLLPSTISDTQAEQAVEQQFPPLAPYYSGIWRAQLDSQVSPFQAVTDFITGYIFQCPLWFNFAAVQQKGLAKSLYLYKFELGIHNPHNDGIDFCDASIPSRVCHEDDILAVFGTYSSSITAQQKALSSEVQARWAQFIRTGNPNTNNYVQWPQTSQTKLSVLLIGNNTVSNTVNQVQCTSIDQLPYDFES